MKYENWTDKIVDKLQLNKAVWIHIGMAVGIAILVSALILLAVTPRNSAIAGLDSAITQTNTAVVGLAGQLASILGMGTLATADQLQGISNKVADHTNAIDAQSGRLNENESRLNALAADLEGLECSPPEVRLGGTFGAYTLYVKASDAGNFTATIHLMYEPPLAVGGVNATHSEALADFYTGMVTNLDRYYVPSLVYSGSDNHWLVTDVSFSAGVFALEPGIEKALNITFSGLTNSYAPCCAYPEVHRLMIEG